MKERIVQCFVGKGGLLIISALAAGLLWGFGAFAHDKETNPFTPLPKRHPDPVPVVVEKHGSHHELAAVGVGVLIGWLIWRHRHRQESPPIVLSCPSADLDRIERAERACGK